MGMGLIICHGRPSPRLLRLLLRCRLFIATSLCDFFFLNLICKARDCHTASLTETGALLLQNTSTFAMWCALTQPRRRQNHLPATLQCFPCCVTLNLLRILDPFWSRTGPWFAGCGRGVHYRTWSIDSNRAAWKPHHAACCFCASETACKLFFRRSVVERYCFFERVFSHFSPQTAFGDFVFSHFSHKKGPPQ